jgi:Fe-S protein assembly co-chaperone HscB
MGDAQAADPLPDPEPGWDHYRVFGLARSAVIDPEELTARLVALSRRLHPDRASDPGAKSRAILQVAKVNEAYAVLADPVRRRDYLLGLLGGPRASEHKDVSDGFLEEMMDLRDELEEVLSSGDAGKIRAFGDRLRARRDAAEEPLEAEFGRLVAMVPDAAGRDELLRGMRERLNESAYFRSLLRDLAGER